MDIIVSSRSTELILVFSSKVYPGPFSGLPLLVVFDFLDDFSLFFVWTLKFDSS
jgi:hypothetical protein